MAKISVILTQINQLKDQPDSVLIDPNDDLITDLIAAAQKAQTTINAVTSIIDLTGKQLTGDGFPEGCFVIFDLRKATVKTDDFLTKLSGLLQDGYQIGLINDLSKYSSDEIKKLKLYKVYLINTGKDNESQDATIKGSNINDIKGKLAKNRSLVEFRDFTNVPTPQAGARVGIGKDTSGLQGGPAIGYSTNGRDFYAAITPYGFTFRKRDAENMWRLLRPKQRDDIDDVVGETVKKEVDSATAGVSDAVNNASDAVSQAESAVAASKVNSDAIKSMQSAASEAKTSADKALSDAQVAIQKVANEAQSIRDSVTSVQSQVSSVQSANDARAMAMQKDLASAQSSISATSTSLDKVSANLDTYAKSAAEQGHDITMIKKQQDSLEADLASANGNVTQLQATVSGIAGNLKDTNNNVASLSATASQAGIAIRNAQSQVASVITRADALQATIADQNKKITAIKATADGASVAASNADSNATQAKLTASEASVTAKDAKSDVLSVIATASDAKVLATNANSQAMEANVAANDVSVKMSGVEKVASDASSKADAANSTANKASSAVTTVQTTLYATQTELSGKADKATVYDTNHRLDDMNAQVKIVAGEVSSKAEQTTVNGLANSLNDLKVKTEWVEKDDIDFNDCKSQMNIFTKSQKNAPNSDYWWYLRVEPGPDGRVTQYATSDRDNHHYTRQFIDSNWIPWKEIANTDDVTNLQAQVTKQSTEISNNTTAINLKADKTVTDAINKTVQEQQAQQKVLSDQIQTKVTSSDVKGILDNGKYATQDFTQNLVTQTSKTLSANITEVKNGADSRMTNLQASIDGIQNTVKDKANQSQITQLTNAVQSKVSSKDYQTTISQLTNDINAKVAKGDLISQINIEAGQTLIQSKKLFLDADSVVFSGKAFIPDASITNLSLDKLTAGHLKIPIADEYGNQIEMGNDGIDVTSAPEDVKWSSIDDSGDKSQFKFNVTAKGVELANHIIYGNPIGDKKSDDYRFLELRPDVLHDERGSSDQVTTPNGMVLCIPTDYSSSLGPSSPGGFFAIGHETTQSQQGVTDRGIDIAYVTKPTNGWKKGLVVDTTMYMKPKGAAHHMRTAWVSWSQWDAGEHYPAIVSDGKWWGGICFPSTGKVTLFDPYGHAMWLTQGNAPYSAWGDDFDS